LSFPFGTKEKISYREGELHLEEGDESLLPAEFLKKETPAITGVESGIE
jgi:hypothetical protein